MTAVSAVLVGVIAPDQRRVASSKRVAVSLVAKAEHRQRALFCAVEAQRHRRIAAALTEARPDGIQGIDKISPGRWRIRAICREPTARPLPSRDRRLRAVDFLGAHSIEEIVPGIVLADVVEAQEPPPAGPVEIGCGQRRFEFARQVAARMRAIRPCPFDPPMPLGRLYRHWAYIGAMTSTSTGPVAAEMASRLTAALDPTELILTDDSEQHRGHGGYNADGESHFTLRVTSAVFAGKSRVERQRIVHKALGDLLDERVHALSIKASAPGE